MQRTAAAKYDEDFALWIDGQIAALRKGRVSDLDIGNLIEELEALAKRDRRELKRRVRRLGQHILKRFYQPEKASGSWEAAILEQGLQIQAILEDSPSLRREMPNIFCNEYERARTLALKETGVPATSIPNTATEDVVTEWCTAAGTLAGTTLMETHAAFTHFEITGRDVPF